MPDSSRRTVVVTGDVTMDWNLASIEQNGADPWGAKSRSPAWETDETTRARQQPGGVALLGKLMKEIGEPLGWTVHEVGEVVEDGGRRFRQSYAVWSPFSHTRGSGGHEPKIWRVQKFLGLDQRGEKEQDREAASAVAEWNQSIDAVAADLVILDDADLSFRTDESLWPRVVREAENEKQAHFVIKMARPVAQGQLFERLVANVPRPRDRRDENQ